ncbi:MAG: DUF167 domain-containing protein [Actinobacteria bacterium]|nr:DUF167 domain-containing protein [Actinomycetota bacterium]
MKTKIIKLIVKPNSAKNFIEGAYQGRIKIKIAASPQKGKANKELIKFIAEKLEIPKKNIKIIAGEKSHLKVLEITDPNNDNLATKLLNENNTSCN